MDTNIIIHREASSVVNEDIGILFRWLDNLHYAKCIHPVSVEEIKQYKDPKTLKALSIKIENYNILKTVAPLSDSVKKLSEKVDVNQNDRNDTIILNELFNDRVDIIVTEDKKLINKVAALSLSDKVFTIDSFLEKVISEHPEFAEYKTLAVRKEFFGNINLDDEFFTSLKEDYPGFEKWFKKKSDESAYVCYSKGQLMAFLYLKVESPGEDYSDIEPVFTPKKRLKIGTFKVILNGFRLGERFLKIIFDNALRLKVEEIYVTIFDRTIEQHRLIGLLAEYGFVYHGHKEEELVIVRTFNRAVNVEFPKLTFPFFSSAQKIFIVPIYPDYHTELFPDSILNTESPRDFIENEPHRNAISKVYISRSIERDLHSGDVILFYRTGGFYKSVVTTIGIVENVITNIKDENEFITLCRKRSVFTDDELKKHWNYYRSNRPFVVNFLYVYSMPRRINLKRLIELGVIKDITSAPRGFARMTRKNLFDILRESAADESIVVN